jgi:esterase/lipase
MSKEPIEFIVDGLTLRGNLFRPAGEEKPVGMLFLHGWTGKPNNEAAAFLAENSYWAMTFSLSGHEGSDGTIEDQTRAKSLKEVLAAYDLFKSKLPADFKIGVPGNSYGGYLAAVLTAERPLACIQMRVPADYTDEGFEELRAGKGSENPEVMKWRHQSRDPNATKSLRALHAFKGPIQIIETELDDVVPHQTVQNYIEAVADKSQLDYHFMKGWPHSLGDDPERNRQYQAILLDWLNKQVE